VIPEEAVEAAVVAVQQETYGADWAKRVATIAVKAAYPILLSHEREETRLAHLDAVVNAESVDRLERELEAAKAKAWDEGEHAGYLNRGAEEFGLRRPNPYRTTK